MTWRILGVGFEIVWSFASPVIREGNKNKIVVKKYLDRIDIKNFSSEEEI